MDEWLQERYRELQEIDERLERIERLVLAGRDKALDEVRSLRRDLFTMIVRAEAAYEAF